MNKIPLKIKFQNGLTFDAVDDILSALSDEYEFIDSEDPEVIIFGPYGNDIPEKGSYQRVGYYCECITPDLEICEWAFGIPEEEEVRDARYKRIQWHGLNPKLLIKNIDVNAVYKEKTKFCNFLYSNPIPYREAFFRQLSAYRQIDAPGKSMHNMPAIDQHYQGDTWNIKRAFVKPYKFTVAFESYAYPGYQTEKLYDAMRMNSIPIYFGDPNIDKIFNPKSFINASDYLDIHKPTIRDFLEKNAQYNFKDYRPGSYTSMYYKVRRKLKTMAKLLKMRMDANNLDFRPLIDRVIHIDKNPELYLEMLTEPWLNDNKPPENTATERWREIFIRAKQ